MVDRIGAVSVDVLGDIGDFDDDLRKRLEKIGRDSDKQGEKAGKDFGGGYVKGFDKETQGKIQASVARGLSKQNIKLTKAAQNVGRLTGAKIQASIATELGKSNSALRKAVQGIGVNAGSTIQNNIAKGLSQSNIRLTRAVQALGDNAGETAGRTLQASMARHLERNPNLRITDAMYNLGGQAGQQFTDGATQVVRKNLPGSLRAALQNARVKAAARSGGGGGGKSFQTGFAEAFGNGLDKALGRQFVRGLPRFYRTILKALPFIVEPIAVGLQGLGGGLLAVGSTALQATPALGGLIPIATGLAASIVPLVVGFDGVGSALGAMTSELADAAKEGRAFNLAAEDIQEALRGLSPAAREFALAVGAILPQYAAFKRAIQENLFAGLGDQFTAFAEQALPGLSAGFQELASSLNSVFSDILTRLGGFDFEGLLGGLAPIIETLGIAFNDLIQFVLEFSAAAAPAAQELAELFQGVTEGLLEWAQAGSATGSISEGIQNAIGPMRILWDAIKETSSALWTLSEIGDQTGRSLVSSFTAQVEAWNAWMQTVEGENAVRNFFELSAESLRAFAPLLKGLQEAFSILVTPETLERFSQFLDSLGQLLPILAEIFVVIGNLGILNLFADLFLMIGEAIRPLLPILGEITTLIGDTFAQVLSAIAPLLQGVAEVFGALLVAVQPLLGPITEVATVLAETLVGALVALLPAILALFEPLLGLVETMVPLFQRFMEEALLPLIEALGPVLGEVLVALTPLLELIVMLFTESADIIIELAIVVVQLVTAILPILPLTAQLIGLFAQLVGTILSFVLPAFTSVISIIAAVASGFLGILAPAIEAIYGVFTQLVAIVSAAFGTIKSAALELWGRFKDLLGNFRSFVDSIRSIFSGVVDAITAPFRSALSQVQGIVERFRGIIDFFDGAVSAIGGFIGGLFGRASAAPAIRAEVQRTNAYGVGRSGFNPYAGAGGKPKTLERASQATRAPISVVQYNTFAQTDPTAVAASVVNRLAAAARY